MGKIIIIKGADFSAVAVDHVTPGDGYVKKYVFGISDNQFMTGKRVWELAAMGYSIADQSKMQGKKLKGIKMNVATVGTFNLYKASNNRPSTYNELTHIATVTAQDIGIQEIAFSSPIFLETNEYLIIGTPNGDGETLKGFYSAANDIIDFKQGFNFRCGSTGVANDGLNPNYTQSLNVDFYY